MPIFAIPYRIMAMIKAWVIPDAISGKGGKSNASERASAGKGWRAWSDVLEDQLIQGRGGTHVLREAAMARLAHLSYCQWRGLRAAAGRLFSQPYVMWKPKREYQAGVDHQYEEAVQALNSLQTNASVLQVAREQGSRSGLANIPTTERFLRKVGVSRDELDKLSVIHVAGIHTAIDASRPANEVFRTITTIFENAKSKDIIAVSEVIINARHWAWESPYKRGTSRSTRSSVSPHVQLYPADQVNRIDFYILVTPMFNS
ncbi:uncharacterized protein LOC119576866 [Penaeus monodon]|uniref:uncharacterized protein LOC119576866 n=1 Tax=Penaeus monodon TaxID=6687 RepID=UPI0018A76617|nr:uncharacterized protein LOC119576866 [Penaeus monodon]